MGCGCAGNKTSSQTSIAGATSNYQQNVKEINAAHCDITKEMLQSWRASLICVKGLDKLSAIKITLVTYNQLLGVIQSALNYPENYCYYKPQLEYFQNTVLPQIVNNVTGCIK